VACATGLGKQMRRNLRTCVAIAVVGLMISAPAMACTDWKAVAAFDAAIVNQARNRVVDERNPKIRASNPDYGLAWEKVEPPEEYNDTMTQLRTDRKSALADTCGGQP
jgi:hypothetical protein